ncbi:MAG: mRNA surveillance protein pelota [Thermoplasmatales archaeon]|nr:mRNA surveillance protein pelota [Thermoplasmatales archaeon]
MKVIDLDLKKGIAKLIIQSKEDCWHLYNIIEEGDFLSGYTFRSRNDSSEKIRKKKEEKERVYLKIEVTDKEFHEFTDKLRIRGKIVEGEEAGAYHTFSIEPNMEIKIEKEWKEHHLKRLKEAEEIKPKFAVLVIDDDEATLAIIHEYGVEEKFHIFSNKSGKDYKNGYDEKEYYGQILKKIKEISLPLAIVGAGFEKDKFLSFAKGEIKNYFVDSVFNSGMAGVYEAIKRGIVSKFMEENRVAKEIGVVEKILEEISKNGNVAYGKSEVEKYVDLGAVEKLVILNSLVREEEETIRKAEENRAEIIFVSELHEGGKKLTALGGIAALLRYKIN